MVEWSWENKKIIFLVKKTPFVEEINGAAKKMP